MSKYTNYNSINDVSLFIEKNDNFVIYGLNNLGKKIHNDLILKYKKNVSSYCQLNSEEIIYNKLPVIKIEDISKKEKIIIASYREFEISKELEKKYNLKYLEDYIFFDHIAFLESPMFHNAFGQPFYKYIKNNEAKINATYKILSDKNSIDTLNKLIDFRINLYNPERINLDSLPTQIEEQNIYEKNAMNYFQEISEQLDESLRKNISFKISLDPYSYLNKVTASNKKNIFNLGSYNNTSVMFSYFSPDANIYAFEPQKEIHNQNVIISKYYPHIVPINAGAWDKTTTLPFKIVDNEGITTSSMISEDSNDYINVYSIDDYVKENNIKNIDFIKMDIEGAEIEALKGSILSIKKFMPDLAISIYHKPEHIVDIPLLIKDFCPEYNIYIGHKYYNPTETVCFATKGKNND